MRVILSTAPARDVRQLARRALTVVGTLSLGYCLASLLGAEFYQAREAREFEQELRLRADSRVAALTSIAPVALPARHGVVGSLQIPRIGVAVMVVEGTDAGDLERAVGHIPGTALPWDSGNVGLAGHRDTFFRPLRSIQRDDYITITTLQGTYRYRVLFASVVRPDDTEVLYPTGHDSLTLVTCFPFEYIGSAPNRFVVRAERIP
ncbi:MAG: class D sortase [Bryobacteraceae bacterium]